MGTSVIANSQNFVREVVDPSFNQPVLVDFFATWCGPCQMLKPVLESLTEEYDFVLAKVDIDQNPNLAKIYGIEGVPDVRIVVEGKMKPGFVGFLPEPQIRDLLKNLGLVSKLDRALTAAQLLKKKGETEAAQTALENLLQEYPLRPEILLAAAEFYQQNQQWETAKNLLAQVDSNQIVFYQKATALKRLLDLQSIVFEGELTDPDRQFQAGCNGVLAQQYEQALEIFLEMVGNDRKYRNDGARKAMITLFDFLGDDHELTRTYRKKLTRLLY